MKNLVSLFVFAMIGSLLSCKSYDGQPVNEQKVNPEREKAKNELLLQAGPLIYNDSLRSEGIEILKGGLSQFPESDIFPGSLGIAYLLDGDTLRANDYFQKALAIVDSVLDVTPTYYDSLQRATYLMVLGREAEGRRLLKETFKIPEEKEMADTISREEFMRGLTRK